LLDGCTYTQRFSSGLSAENVPDAVVLRLTYSPIVGFLIFATSFSDDEGDGEIEIVMELGVRVGVGLDLRGVVVGDGSGVGIEVAEAMGIGVGLAVGEIELGAGVTADFSIRSKTKAAIPTIAEIAPMPTITG
jgi:hypothetical protein